MTCVPHTARISNVDSVMFCKWNKKDGPPSHRDSMVSKAPYTKLIYDMGPAYYFDQHCRWRHVL